MDQRGLEQCALDFDQDKFVQVGSFIVTGLLEVSFSRCPHDLGYRHSGRSDGCNQWGRERTLLNGSGHSGLILDKK